MARYTNGVFADCSNMSDDESLIMHVYLYGRPSSADHSGNGHDFDDAKVKVRAAWARIRDGRDRQKCESAAIATSRLAPCTTQRIPEPRRATRAAGASECKADTHTGAP